jgi:hypothetical protein
LVFTHCLFELFSFFIILFTGKDFEMVFGNINIFSTLEDFHVSFHGGAMEARVSIAELLRRNDL